MLRCHATCCYVRPGTSGGFDTQVPVLILDSKSSCSITYPRTRTRTSCYTYGVWRMHGCTRCALRRHMLMIRAYMACLSSPNTILQHERPHMQGASICLSYPETRSTENGHEYAPALRSMLQRFEIGLDTR